MAEEQERDVEEVVKERLDETKSFFQEKLEEKDQAIEELEQKVDEQIKNNGEPHEEHVEQLEEMQKEYNELAERLDSVEKTNGRLKGAEKEKQSFKAELTEVLSDGKDQLINLKDKGTGNIKFDMDTKATMTESSDLTNQVIEPERVPGVKYDNERMTHVRNFIPVASTTSNVVWYIQEENFTDNTATTGENANKPESDFDLNQQSANVQKITNTFRVSTEMLDDVEYLSGHISTRGRTKYMLEEDDQILHGSGTGQDLNGLTNSTTGYTSNLSGFSNANEYDIIVDTIRDLANNDYRPTACMVAPERYYQMLLAKDADGNYVMPEAVLFNGQPPRVDGVPVIVTTALNNDEFLIADFPMLTTIYDRQGVTVRFFEQDRDNVQKNLVTVQIEGRLALPTYLPNAGRYGDFASAITAAGNS